MVHLLPLPGSPRWGGSLDAVVERAVADARALRGRRLRRLPGGELRRRAVQPGPRRSGDRRGHRRRRREVRRAVSLPVGINVLKNDAQAALAVAAAVGAAFVGSTSTSAPWSPTRACSRATPTGRSATGASSGRRRASSSTWAGSTPCRWRRSSSSRWRGTPPPGPRRRPRRLGVATGEPTPLGDVKRVRAAVPDRPILVGSGVSPRRWPGSCRSPTAPSSAPGSSGTAGRPRPWTPARRRARPRAARAD